MASLVSVEERDEILRRIHAGQTYKAVAAATGRSTGTVCSVVRRAGGLPSRCVERTGLRLGRSERDEIAIGLAQGLSLRAIAARLGRAPSTVSREVAAGGGRRRYRPTPAQQAAWQRARRPKTAKLAGDPRLRAAVEAGLARRWSPRQISARLEIDFPDDETMRVSHETIYQSLFVQSRGALRKQLTAALRSGRVRRRPRAASSGRRGIIDMTLISDRPAEVDDRAVPGHWEGDLLVGAANRSAIATLVERTTRFTLLAAVAGQDADSVRRAITAQILTLPEQLRRTLTWDQGREMAQHARFCIDTGVAVYFCDPRSPWQRGSNENTNGLLRQYLPKGMDLSTITQAELDATANELNDRPRQTLEWLKPSEKLAELIAVAMTN